MNTNDTVSVVFTEQELWLLQSVVRHEQVHQSEWHFPPASIELNSQIAAALYFCSEYQQTEAPLLVSLGDCLVIDYCIQSSMKTANGELIGKSILMHSFAARAALRDGTQLDCSEPPAPSVAEIQARLAKSRGTAHQEHHDAGNDNTADTGSH